MRKKIILLFILASALCAAGSGNKYVKELGGRLYESDKQIKARHEPFRGTWSYERPANVAMWFDITDDGLTKLFNHASAITFDDKELVFTYADQPAITMKIEVYQNRGQYLYYEVYWGIGTTITDEDETSDLWLKIKPVSLNKREYYFTVMERTFQQRGGETYGAFRILAKDEAGKYRIITKQEDVLPVVDEINRILKSNDHDTQKMAWVPWPGFMQNEEKNGILYFTFQYSFDVPRRTSGSNDVEIDWRFDGKHLLPLKMRLLPWYEGRLNESKTDLVKHEGKEFIINQEK